MNLYIQKLHEENKDDKLRKTLMDAFSDFEITYEFDSRLVGIATFKMKEKVVAQICFTSFNTYAISMDEKLKKRKFENKVRNLYLNFMKSNFLNYEISYNLAHGIISEDLIVWFFNNCKY